jgi:hypothetical protein
VRENWLSMNKIPFREKYYTCRSPIKKIFIGISAVFISVSLPIITQYASKINRVNIKK